MKTRVKLSDIAIVAGDAAEAERLCAQFRFPGTYVVLHEAPRLRMVEEGVFAADCLRVTNAIRAHEPSCVVLSSCSDATRAELNVSLPAVSVVVIEKCDDTAIAGLRGYRAREILPREFRQNISSNGNIVAVEDGDSMAAVFARNLAVAQAGSVFIMPPISKGESEAALEQWMRWNTESGIEKDAARDAFLNFLRNRLGPLANAGLDSISFVAEKLPYGVYPFACPTTHYFSYPHLGEDILGGMLKSLRPRLRCPAVVVIDPASVGAREAQTVAETFGRRGYLIRRAVAERATTQEARYLTEHLPSDFLFYSTHCGEVRGTRFTEEFATTDGKSHVISYDLVVQVSAAQQAENVEVLDFRRWLSIDGIPWSNSAGKEAIGAGAILREFLDLMRKRRGDISQMKVLHSEPISSVRFSDALAMHNGDIYIPMPQNIGGYHRPIVFNNACSSWRELASRFVGHGASMYIGTSFDVLDSVAYSVACSFAESAASGRSLGHALYRAQKEFIAQLGYTPYLMNGYLFTHLRPLNVPISDLVHSRLRNALELHAADRRLDPAHRWQVESITEFLRKELELFSNAKRIPTS